MERQVCGKKRTLLVCRQGSPLQILAVEQIELVHCLVHVLRLPVGLNIGGPLDLVEFLVLCIRGLFESAL